MSMRDQANHREEKHLRKTDRCKRVLGWKKGPGSEKVGFPSVAPLQRAKEGEVQ